MPDPKTNVNNDMQKNSIESPPEKLTLQMKINN